jgi:hypothetical protein
LQHHTEGFRGSGAYQDWRHLLHNFYDPFPTIAHYAELVRISGEIRMIEEGPRSRARTGYVSLLEHGKRVPSVAVAQLLIDAYELPDGIARALREVTRPFAGRSSPCRTSIASGGRRSTARPG